MEKRKFYDNLKFIALPITIQSLFQAILSLIDEVMIGDLGTASIAGVGLSIKFTSLFSVVMTAIVTVAGILIAQYKGNEDEEGMCISFFSNLYLLFGIVLVFILLAVFFPEQIMTLYSKDSNTVHQAAIYLRIVVIGFIPQILVLMISTLLRNMDAAKELMYASVVSVVTNTIFNYLLIYGVGVFPRMEIRGAATATCLSRVVELIFVWSIYKRVSKKTGFHLAYMNKVSYLHLFL